MILDCNCGQIEYKSQREVHAMSSNESRIADGAPSELAAFVEIVERLHREHRVSFVAAGDERIYAYGGRGYVVIMSEREFGGLVEVETPSGTIRIEPDADGRAAIASAGDDPRPIGARLAEARASLEAYYAGRYWRP
jgi:hypothetical protein